MISCTEFIPLYSELFNYIEDNADYAAVRRYWAYLKSFSSDHSLAAKMEKYNGLRACWEYWSHTLPEEAADFIMTWDEEEEYFEILMRHCPSRGMLNDFAHLEPYHSYCAHCADLYAPIMASFGFDSFEDYTRVDEAKCLLSFFPKGKKPKRYDEPIDYDV